MWLLKLLSGVFDLFTTVDTIKDIKENGWNWRRFFWVTAFTIALCGSALLLTNGHPVLGALGIAGVIIAGFVLLICRILINDKLAHKKREEEMQKIQAEQSGD
jgi:hypothetical protein